MYVKEKHIKSIYNTLIRHLTPPHW